MNRLFAVKKTFLLLEIPDSEQNEIASKRFIKKFHQFTGDKYDIAVKWLTKKVKSLFPLKDRNLHPSCKIYKDINAVVEKLALVKPFVMLKNVGQNTILLRINQNQPNVLLIRNNTSFCGVFYLLLQKMVEHVKT